MMRAIVLSFMFAAAGAAWAAGGHEHGGAAAPEAGAPRRQPDGSVFLPKPAQRQLEILTMQAQEEALSRSTELAGRVVMNPNAGGKVQAMTSGRLEAGPSGLPQLGQAVRKGDVLAYIVASTAPLERSAQAAQLAEWRAAGDLARQRLARLEALSDTVPRKEIEAARSEVASLAARASAIGAGLSGREALVAPVSGVIATANGVAGQVVDARELVFEIVDATRLDVEALAYDDELAANVASGSLAIGKARVPLQFLGAARALREQALPMRFRVPPDAVHALALGQPVKVFVQTRSTVKGVAVPAASLMRNPSNQTIVWVKTAAERFEPRVVATQPLDGVSVAVTSGLGSGERVVTQGASLVNQIR